MILVFIKRGEARYMEKHHIKTYWSDVSTSQGMRRMDDNEKRKKRLIEQIVPQSPPKEPKLLPF